MNKMPVVFIGHGSPMNAIEDNEITKGWIKIASDIPTPKAILVVSAHWYTKGIKVNDDLHPKTTYDMYGFPNELYEIVYNSNGAPNMAHIAKELIGEEASIDNSWGYDHGAWSILNKMYPNRDIPVFQISIDSNKSAEDHYKIGKKLKSLREMGVLILASGNIVHNLRKLDWSMENGYDWAEEFEGYIKNNILDKQYNNIVNYENAGLCARLSVPTPEHFYPLLYILGAADEEEAATIYNEVCVFGSLSMTCYLFK